MKQNDGRARKDPDLTKTTATLADIADRSSVSIATVSRVLNNRPYVNEETRRAVLTAAAELGYRLAQRKTGAQTKGTVLLLIMRELKPENVAINGGWEGFNHFVDAGAYGVLKAAGLTPRTDRLQARFDDGLISPDVAGVLLIGGSVSPALLDTLKAHDVPCVAVGAHVNPNEIDSVMADVLHGTKEAVSHLAATRRRKIALINGPVDTRTSQEKYEGWRLGLALHGLEFRPDLLLPGNFTANSGHSQTHALLDQVPDVDAIIYADDFMALGGVKALNERGKNIPDDVAIIGFHDYPIALYTTPPLTSVGFDMQRMGAIAAQRLVQLLESSRAEDPWAIQVPTSLRVRASTSAGTRDSESH